MSSSVCRACKHQSTCTFPRNVVIVQCEEYEYAEAPQELKVRQSEGLTETSDHEPEVVSSTATAR
jgi:hypothetical protein